MARPDHPRRDVVRALQPELERRHVLGDVGGQQSDERVDVVGLEGADVLLQERLWLSPSGSVRPTSGRSASVARARCSALFTDAVVVSSSEATSSAFQRSTSRRISTTRWRAGQVLQRGDEREPHRLPRHRDLGRVPGLGQHPLVHHRLQPGVLAARADQRGLDGLPRRRRQVHGAARGPASRSSSGRRSSRSGTATTARRSGPRTPPRTSRPAPSCPARRPRRRRPSPASGSSSRAARTGVRRARVRARPGSRGRAGCGRRHRASTAQTPRHGGDPSGARFARHVRRTGSLGP